MSKDATAMISGRSWLARWKMTSGWPGMVVLVVLVVVLVVLVVLPGPADWDRPPVFVQGVVSARWVPCWPKATGRRAPARWLSMAVAVAAAAGRLADDLKWGFIGGDVVGEVAYCMCSD